MEVTYTNFESLLPRIEEALTNCHFCAIDAEFSGLSLTNPRREDVLDDPEQRYARVRTAAQNFLIIQFGLSTFNWDPEEECYEAKTFNFYIFPRAGGGTDVRFTCQASSLDFLREHGFNFNKFIYSGKWITEGCKASGGRCICFLDNHKWRCAICFTEACSQLVNNSDAGIPYVTLEQLKWEKKAELREPRDAIVLKKEDDQNFVAQQMQSVRSWMESTAVKEVGSECPDMEPATLTLEPSNSYLRAALYQHLEQEYGKSDFYIEHLRAPGARKSSLKLTSATSEMVAAQESEVAAKRQRQVERAKGFANVMQLLTTCNKPVVGHNMLMDLAYVYQQFIGQLPPSLDDFREQLKLLFPGGLYDTKYLAGFFPNLLPYTSLEELHTYLAPKASDAEIAVSAEDDVEHQSNAPSTDDSHNNMILENEAPKGDVHNEEGLASEAHQEDNNNVHVILADLSRLRASTKGQLTRVELPRIEHADEFDRYTPTADEPSRYHEAGFDAYMTGTIFVWLTKLFEAKSISNERAKIPLEFQAIQEFINRIFVMRSDLAYIPLEGPISVPDRSSMFILSSTNALPLPSQDELMLRFSGIGCEIDRILWLNQMTCYVTISKCNEVSIVTQAIKDAGWPMMFGPFRSTAEFQEPLIQL